ncbi:hypothetical protein GCM10011608_53990 [Micromonospora sonchi]|uniref:Uncharacterized protein n=1 Tax=Micromonospora sonchi TaxID=1763543 RepID=A0A917X3U4_9ACTN|nr:hypothetical protein GCM10011608_53990 [Micromonospora sonchi]
MPGGVEVDPPSVTARLKVGLGSAQRQHHGLGLGLIDIVDGEIEVQLLRASLRGPARRLVTIDALKTDESEPSPNTSLWDPTRHRDPPIA